MLSVGLPSTTVVVTEHDTVARPRAQRELAGRIPGAREVSYDGDSATVKQYQRQGAIIRLIPANPTMEPMEFEEHRVQIQGVVIGVLRRY